MHANQWINHVEGATTALRNAVGQVDAQSCRRLDRGFSRRAVEALRVVLPYCLAPVDDTSSTLIWLNRDYKPLGCPDRGLSWYDYREHPHVHVDASHPAAAVVHQFATNNEHPADVLDRGTRRTSWLFDDSCAPWTRPRHAARLLATLDAVLASCVRDAPEEGGAGESL
jgi:hypothetical protein